MQDAYVDWLYNAMVHSDFEEFGLALEHAAKSLGEASTRAAFVEAHDMLVGN